MDPIPPTVASPAAVSTLKTEEAGPMERSLSQDIRDEREDLREAAEATLNVIVDLNLDGTIRWASPSWADVIGTQLESVESLPMSDLVVSENKNVFSDVVDSMKKDDSKSHKVRFSVQLGPHSKLREPESDQSDKPESQEPQPQNAELEAQGIMVYDSVSGGESHVSPRPSSPSNACHD